MIRTGSCVFLLAALGLTLTLGASCAKPPAEEIEERAGPQFFCVELIAAPDLNIYRGTPASLTLAAYQLKNRQGIDSLRDLSDGMETLLAGEKFDESVAGSQRIFLNPGERKVLRLERRRGVKYVALAAGYCESSMEESLLIVSVPPVVLPKLWRKPSMPVIRALLESDRLALDRSKR